MILFLGAVLAWADHVGRKIANVPPAGPMRTENEDGEVVVDRPDPIEDEREYGEPVGVVFGKGN